MKQAAAFFVLGLSLMSAGCAPMGGRDGPGREGGAPPGGRGEAGFDGPRSVSASGGGFVLEQVQRQLADTALALELNPRQRPLWDAYQARIGALMADQMRIEFNATIKRDAPRQIDARVDTVRNRLAAMEEIADAARLLYQSLDETQKEVADRRLAATVPALYSGIGGLGVDVAGKGAKGGGPGGPGRPGGRGGPGGGGGSGPGGGAGGW